MKLAGKKASGTLETRDKQHDLIKQTMQPSRSNYSTEPKGLKYKQTKQNWTYLTS